MCKFENIEKLREYIKKRCTKELYDTILNDEYHEEISNFLLKLDGYKESCKLLKETFNNNADNENMYNILNIVGFDERDIQILMKKIGLTLPTSTPAIQENRYTDNNSILINYDEAWREKIFTRHFKELDNANNCTLDKIIDIAGKVYHDKEVLDYIVGYRTTESFDEPSVWGITEEIIKRYQHLSFLKNENTQSLSLKIGKAITDWNSKQ